MMPPPLPRGLTLPLWTRAVERQFWFLPASEAGGRREGDEIPSSGAVAPKAQATFLLKLLGCKRALGENLCIISQEKHVQYSYCLKRGVGLSHVDRELGLKLPLLG